MAKIKKKFLSGVATPKQRFAQRTQVRQEEQIQSIPWFEARLIWFLLISGLALLIVYWPAIHGDWIWDDFRYLPNNPHLRDLAGLWKLWTTPQEGYTYWPLSYLGFWLIKAIAGLQPTVFHGVNLFLHFGNLALLLVLLKHMRVPGAIFAVLLFAFHPLQVESVAWISEFKNLLATVFFLLSLLGLGHYLETDKKVYYWLSLVSFLAALLAKIAVVFLPFLLCIIVTVREDKISLRPLLMTIPYWLVGGVFSVLFFYVEINNHTELPTAVSLGLLQKTGLCFYNLVFYALKWLLPYPLSSIYPKAAWILTPWGSIILNLGWVALVYFCIKLYQERRLALLGLIGFYISALAPILGLVEHQMNAVTNAMDHYTYFANIAPSMMAGIALWNYKQMTLPMNSMRLNTAILENQYQLFPDLRVAYKPALLFFATWLLLLAGTSWLLTQKYFNATVFWEQAQRHNPDSDYVLYNVGTVQLDVGKFDQAIETFTQIINRNDQHLLARQNRAAAYQLLSKWPEALADYNQVLKINPQFSAAWMNRGVVLQNLNREQEALEDLNRAVELTPGSVESHINRGQILLEFRRFREAFEDFNFSIQIQPELWKTSYGRALALQGLAQHQEAVQDFNQFLLHYPNFAQGYIQRSYSLLELNRENETLADIEKSLSLSPNNPLAHAQKGQYFWHFLKSASLACQEWTLACQMGHCDDLKQAQFSKLCP